MVATTTLIETTRQMWASDAACAAMEDATRLFFSDEIVHILEGEVFVDDGARKHHLVAGSIAYFPAGLEAEWHVPKYVRKMYIGRATRRSRLRRLAARVERKIAKLAGL